MPLEQDIFHDITDASGFQPSSEFPILWIILGLVLLSFLLIGVALLIRNNTKKPEAKRASLAQTALKKLPELQDASANQSVQQSASDLSSLLRSTLTFTVKSPSAYQSQQEFHQHSDFELPDPQLKSDFSLLLDSLWGLEYTPPSHNTETMKPHYETAASLLKKLATHSA